MGDTLIIDGASLSFNDLVAWVASSGALLSLISVAVTQVLWMVWARLRPLSVPAGNRKRGISLLVPFVLIMLWYGVAILLGHDTLTWARWWIWIAVGMFGATGKQIGWFVYILLKGEKPAAGQEVPTLQDVLALARTADWRVVLNNLPVVIAALFAAPVPAPAPVPPPLATPATPALSQEQTASVVG